MNFNHPKSIERQILFDLIDKGLFDFKWNFIEATILYEALITAFERGLKYDQEFQIERILEGIISKFGIKRRDIPSLVKLVNDFQSIMSQFEQEMEQINEKWVYSSLEMVDDINENEEYFSKRHYQFNHRRNKSMSDNFLKDLAHEYVNQLIEELGDDSISSPEEAWFWVKNNNDIEQDIINNHPNLRFTSEQEALEEIDNLIKKLKEEFISYWHEILD